MLVIRRRIGQSLCIGAEIEVEILEVGNNKVKLGISGPRAVQVIRKEIELAAMNNSYAGSLSAEMKDLIVKKVARIAQPPALPADKNCESRCSGHPPNAENPDPA